MSRAERWTGLHGTTATIALWLAIAFVVATLVFLTGGSFGWWPRLPGF